MVISVDQIKSPVMRITMCKYEFVLYVSRIIALSTLNAHISSCLEEKCGSIYSVAADYPLSFPKSL